MELRSDLLKVVQGSTELVRKAGNLQVPSWRFPEKLAVSLDVEEALKKGPSGANSNIFFLELLIDRLLLLVQCSVQVLENTSSGRKSSGSPLTLGSAVKRVSKCILRSCAKIASLKEELSAAIERITFLESSQILQSKNEPLIAADTKTINIDSCNTLKIIAGSNWMNPTASTRETTSTSTQTTETVFSPCNRCFATNLALVSTVQLVSEQCSKLQLHSKLASTNWSTQAEEVGRLDLVKWSEAYQLDMKSLEKSRLLLEEKVAVLVPEKYNLEASVCFMENESHELREQISYLKVNIEKAKCYSEAILTSSKEEFATTIADLEEVRKELKFSNVELKSKLIASQEEIAILNAAVLRQEAHSKKLKSDLHMVEGRESELKRAKEEIDKQLELLVDELNKTQEVLGGQQVELKKSKVYNESLEKKHRTLREKQSILLQRLDDLDQECSLLRDEVAEVKSSRELHAVELQNIRIDYQQVEQQLSMRQRELSEACKEKEKLRDQLSSFLTELATTRYQLESEKLNCRLLMGFPFVSQTDEAYTDYIVSLIYKKLSHKQITANSVRIYLLEEQNNELRYLNLKEVVKNRDHICSHQNKMKWPVQLWKKDLINQLESKKDLCTVPVEQSSNTELFSEFSPRFKEALEHDSEVIPESVLSSSATENKGQGVRNSGNLPVPSLWTVSSNKRSVSAEEHLNMKGHLGYLMRAIDSHRSSSAGTSSESTHKSPPS